MDLRRYLESEDEERDSGYGSAQDTGSVEDEGYQGDPGVFVPHSAVVVERLRPEADGFVQEAYLARPPGGGSAPAVLVIHENKGLVPYITNVARRLAQHGYVAVAPDLLSRAGGTSAFATPGEVTAALAGIDGVDVVDDVRAVLAGVASLDVVDPARLGIMGFCYGGGVAWRVLTQEPRLSVGVPFYGPPPDLETVPGIQAPVLAVYGELDERITSTLPGIREAMATHGKVFEHLVLEGAPHAFHNDTNADRYHGPAARQAWDRALAYLDTWLGAA